MGNIYSSSTPINPLTGRAYSASTTGDQVAADNATAARGRVVFITGGGGGLGYETARVLASVGARVFITCRTVAGAESTARELQQKAATVYPQAEVHGLALDLSSVASVRACAESFLALKQPLHVLINNAGVMACPLSKTSDGFEMQFGVNHVGHFLLTNLLLDTLLASGPGARVVNLASLAHYLFAPLPGILFDDLAASRTEEYDAWLRYGHSKLANVLHARALQQRHPELVAVSLHPGNIASTDLGRHNSVRSLLWAVWTARDRRLIFSLKSLAQGVATTVFCALDPSVANFRGEYFMDCAPNTPYVHPRAHDDQMAAKLWEVSDELVRNALRAADSKK